MKFTSSIVAAAFVANAAALPGFTFVFPPTGNPFFPQPGTTTTAAATTGGATTGATTPTTTATPTTTTPTTTATPTSTTPTTTATPTTTSAATTSATSTTSATKTGATAAAFTPVPLRGCLKQGQATQIVNAFNYLLANPAANNFNATANNLLSNTFTDTSDSINQLAGNPEGSVTFANKADFIAGSGSQAPLILATLDIFWSCNAISWRWVSVKGAGDDSEPVKGIDNFYINKKGQINEVYAEFNSGAWLKDLGYPECTASVCSANGY